MTSCEKCWTDAYFKYARCGVGRSQTEVYEQLLDERKDNPCSPQEQAGQWWNEELQIDERLIEETK